MEQKFAVVGDFATLLTGAGAPASTLGSVGDMYIDTTSWNIYGPKASGGWGSPVSLIGPPGLEGSYSVVTTIGNPGSDANIAGEQATRELVSGALTPTSVSTGAISGTSLVSTGAISGTSLAINGPIKPSVLAKTATYEILDTDPDIIVIGVISAHATITLPTAADNTGRIITVIIDGEPGAYNVIVDGEGAETINGAATKTNSVIYSYLRLLCNGVGWDIIGSGGTWT